MIDSNVISIGTESYILLTTSRKVFLKSCVEAITVSDRRVKDVRQRVSRGEIHDGAIRCELVGVGKPTEDGIVYGCLSVATGNPGVQNSADVVLAKVQAACGDPQIFRITGWCAKSATSPLFYMLRSGKFSVFLAPTRTSGGDW